MCSIEPTVAETLEWRRVPQSERGKKQKKRQLFFVGVVRVRIDHS
jgi:hypothetical protein